MIEIDNFDLIADLISNNEVDNLNVLGRIRNSKNLKLYVDRELDPEGFILVDDEWIVPFGKNKEAIRDMFASYKLPDELNFPGIPFQISQWIGDLIPSYRLVWDEYCDLFYLPKSKFDDILGIDQPTLENLNETDIEVVDSYYTYRDEGSKDYLLDCIKNRPSSVIRDDNGNPVSWALLREDDSMGVMYTLLEYRGKGVAKKVSIDLMKKTINLGLTPYVHIVETNEASKKLASSLGMIEHGRILWFGLKANI